MRLSRPTIADTLEAAFGPSLTFNTKNKLSLDDAEEISDHLIDFSCQELEVNLPRLLFFFADEQPLSGKAISILVDVVYDLDILRVGGNDTDPQTPPRDLIYWKRSMEHIRESRRKAYSWVNSTQATAIAAFIAAFRKETNFITRETWLSAYRYWKERGARKS